MFFTLFYEISTTTSYYAAVFVLFSFEHYAEAKKLKGFHPGTCRIPWKGTPQIYVLQRWEPVFIQAPDSKIATLREKVVYNDNMRISTFRDGSLTHWKSEAHWTFFVNWIHLFIGCIAELEYIVLYIFMTMDLFIIS